MSNIYFKYENNRFSGLFKYVRSSAQDTVKIYSPKSHVTYEGEYCKNYTGKEAIAIIDGNETTAWANADVKSENTFFIIDLGIGSFLIESFDLRTTCNPPKEVEVLGSNDNLTFNHICTVYDMTNSYQFFHQQCNSYFRSYRYFKFWQNTSVIGTNRFHLSELEFYGILNPSSNTCKHSTYSLGIAINNFVLISILS